MAQAKSQGVSNVFDSKYTPISDEDKELFRAQQTFVFAVPDRTLLTEKGKSIVRTHNASGNAQEIWKELRAHQETSIGAILTAHDLLRHITTANYGPHWTGTTLSFILHWMEQVRLYTNLAKKSDVLSDTLTRTLLMNAVQNLAPLNAIRTMDSQHVARGDPPLTYVQYTTLLQTAAKTYDVETAANASGGPSNRSKRSVYYNDTYSANYNNTYDMDGNEDDYHECSPYDNDPACGTMTAYATERRKYNPAASMPKRRWLQLNKDDQAIWDTLSEATKIIILDKAPPNHDQRLTTREAQSHALDFVRNQLAVLRVATEIHRPASHKTVNFIEPDIENGIADPVKFLTNASKTRIPSSDIRRVLSKSIDRECDKHLRPASAHASEVTFNGVRYIPAPTKTAANEHTIHYSASEHNIAYHVSERNTNSKGKPGGLVDRGANGCVFGDDVRTISESNRSVDITGVDNHQICNIKIGTSGGVINTQNGPVIAIFHQGAQNGRGKSILSCAQMEHFQADVNDKSIRVPGGTQCIRTLDGLVIPLNMRNGLPYIDLRPYTVTGLRQEWLNPGLFRPEE